MTDREQRAICEQEMEYMASSANILAFDERAQLKTHLNKRIADGHLIARGSRNPQAKQDAPFASEGVGPRTREGWAARTIQKHALWAALSPGQRDAALARCSDVEQAKEARVLSREEARAELDAAKLARVEARHALPGPRRHVRRGCGREARGS